MVITLAEVQYPNKIFAEYLIEIGMGGYLNRMRKTANGYRCMNFEMNIKESTIVRKQKMKKPYGRDYYENVTEVTTHKVTIERVQSKNGTKLVKKIEVIRKDFLPYWQEVMNMSTSTDIHNLGYEEYQEYKLEKLKELYRGILCMNSIIEEKNLQPSLQSSDDEKLAWLA